MPTSTQTLEHTRLFLPSTPVFSAWITLSCTSRKLVTDLIPSRRCSKCPFVEKGDSSTEEEAQKSSLIFELTAQLTLSLPWWFIYLLIYFSVFVSYCFIYSFIFLTVFRLSIDVTLWMKETTCAHCVIIAPPEAANRGTKGKWKL